jgi:hypothetical protein
MWTPSPTWCSRDQAWSSNDVAASLLFEAAAAGAFGWAASVQAVSTSVVGIGEPGGVTVAVGAGVRRFSRATVREETPDRLLHQASVMAGGRGDRRQLTL